MIVDSSALVAIVTQESTADACLAMLLSAPIRRLSAGNYLEAAIVLSRVKDDVYSAEFDELIAISEIVIEPVTAQQARIAQEAHRRYGRGSKHRAHLNFGDCFAYALAKIYDEPLLFVGNDFIHTDLRPALMSD
ncbi:MAG: type II toxin-antitoxin system VapC family toxin [Thermomicrobiales bacterium]